MADISKIKLSGTVYDIKDPIARSGISGKSTVTDSETNGNIKVDGEEVVVYELPQAYKDYLDEATFKKPVISTLQLLDIDETAIGSTYELGTSVLVSKIKHKETNIANISGNLTLNGQTITPADSDTVVGITTAEPITSTTTYILSGTDTRGGAVSKSATVTFNRYAYSKLTTATAAPTTGLTKEAEQSSFKSNGKDFTYTAGQYLYIYLTESGKQAQTNVLGQWVDVASNVSEEITITQANGATCTYYAYQIGPFVANGTAKYRVK